MLVYSHIILSYGSSWTYFWNVIGRVGSSMDSVGPANDPELSLTLQWRFLIFFLWRNYSFHFFFSDRTPVLKSSSSLLLSLNVVASIHFCWHLKHHWNFPVWMPLLFCLEFKSLLTIGYACREVVRSPMVEAQCSVLLCFPVELKNGTMVCV